MAQPFPDIPKSEIKKYLYSDTGILEHRSFFVKQVFSDNRNFFEEWGERKYRLDAEF
jgi:hypothetical protein